MTAHVDGHNRIVVATEPGEKLRIDGYRRDSQTGKWLHEYGGIHPAAIFSTPTDKEPK
ncbi:hypothetical protein ACT89R_01820 [Rhodococcus qingshengii]